MPSVNGPKLVKLHNLQLARRQLFLQRAATRLELSQTTGISTVTLGTLLRELVQLGQVTEEEAPPPASGRPSRVYRFNADLSHGLLVSVENHRLNTAVIDLYGQVLQEESLPSPSLDAAGTLSFFQGLIRGRNIRAVSVGLPGVGFGKYLSGQRSSQPLSLEALAQLERETGIPFAVENDVNLMAAGHAHRHGLPDNETLAYLYLMKGSFGGSGIWLGQRLHHGKNRYAGELLFPPYGPDWSQADRLTPGQQAKALRETALPYLSILAPHRMVIASDYLDPACLPSLEAAADAALWSGSRPELIWERDPHPDYEEGLKQAVLTRLQQPILSPNT